MSGEEAMALFLQLQRVIHWQHLPIILFGKQVLQPRLTAWCALDNKSYSYAGLKMPLQEMPNCLTECMLRINAHCGEAFNSVLLNYYRNGQDSMGWHRDNEPELGNQPTIASLSLGEARIFRIRKYKQHEVKSQLILEHGSLLVMRHQAQQLFEHALPKTTKSSAPRMNLTFRRIVTA
jgi:alkylated DNA repair dioxygenase AlkB